jgi:hypothetical protein
MNKRLLAGWALAAAAAAAFAQGRSGPIAVQVNGGQVSVSSSPALSTANSGPLVWQLATKGYRFTADSINFGDAQSYFSCDVVNGGQAVRCTKGDGAPSGRIPYSISVEPDSSGAAAQSVQRSPSPNFWIQNN